LTLLASAYPAMWKNWSHRFNQSQKY
jgi:hypothetical protein